MSHTRDTLRHFVEVFLFRDSFSSYSFLFLPLSPCFRSPPRSPPPFHFGITPRGGGWGGLPCGPVDMYVGDPPLMCIGSGSGGLDWRWTEDEEDMDTDMDRETESHSFPSMVLLEGLLRRTHDTPTHTHTHTLTHARTYARTSRHSDTCVWWNGH